jgi:hypothetical protein
VLGLALAGALVAGVLPGPLAGPRPATAATTVSVTVVGNRLENGAGQPLRLLGVDRSGTEYACIQGWGIFDGPADAASVAAMAAWHSNAVRIPLNEDCWLGINGVSPSYGGAAYQSAIENYVALLHQYGLVAILDLHWNAPGTEQATGQQVMADADHSPAFWTSVATAFKADPGVVFDLYNEPHDISWSCWLSGCTTSGGWAAAGMQTLLNAVRATGATQPVMVGGLNWGGDLSSWLANEPVDPLHQLVASVHLYNFSECNTESCWQSSIAPVAAQVPVVTGELGENDCGTSFINAYMPWADQEGISYLGWTWDAGGGWTCTGGPSLITDYAGDPTTYGAGLQAHLAAVAGGGGTSPVLTVSPTTLAFGSVTVGQRAPAQTVTVAATGTKQVTVHPVTLTGGGATRYQLTADGCSTVALNPGSSCQVSVAFTPGTRGVHDATLKVPTTAGTKLVKLTGTGVAAGQGTVTVAYSVVNSWPGGLQAQLAITNKGTTPLGSATSPWVLGFHLPSADSITDLWNGTLTQTPGSTSTAESATGPSWEAAIPPGATWDVGFTQNGTDPPAGCTMDGTACTLTGA